MERIRVLVAEDEEAVREALVDLLSSDATIDVVGSAKDADEAIEMAAESKPHVALVDVKMPGGGGARAAREIRTNSPQTHVVALSAYEDRRTVLEMLRAGAVGYLVKGTSADEILRTVRRSIRGQGSLSAEVTADVIHELVSLLDRSEALSRDLEELDHTKSELIQILSHELFTPMTTIQGFAMLVSEQGEALKPDEVRDLAEGVVRANDRLKRLVGNLAAAARMDRAGVEVATRPMAAGDLVDRALSEFPRFEGRIVTAGSLAEPETRLWADLELGARALVVVLENALAFSPDTAIVEISARSVEGNVRVTVSDRGPGVPEELRDRIFEAFTQTDGSVTRSHEGLGIGLFLARRIMRAHAGELTYRPRPDGGSCFELSFPGFVSGVERSRSKSSGGLPPRTIRRAVSS